MNKYQQYLLALVKAAITEQAAPMPPENLDWGIFAQYAEEQQFEHIIYPLLKDKREEINIDEDIWHHLQQRYGRVIKRDMIQDTELEEICNAFSAEKIKHIPFKGSTVKCYYPYHDLRRSSDFDILVQEENRKKAGDILKMLGYEQKSAGQTMDDTFRRGKAYVELHFMLTAPTATPHEAMKKVWEYAVKDKEYTYKMQPEFLYVYLLSHLQRHLLSGGGGIKLITDFYVLNKALKFNEEKLNKIMREAYLGNLNSCVCELVNKWFYDENNVSEYTLIIEKLLLNGTAYGDYETAMKMKFSGDANNKSGFSKIIRFIFPSAEYLKVRYKVLEKYPILLPIMWVRRLTDFKHYNPKVIVRSAKSEDTVLHDFCEYINK